MNDGEVSYWVWLCRWLWKLWTALGILVALPLIVNIISTWLTTSRGKLPDDAPFSILMAHCLIVLIVSGCLLCLAVLSWAISRWDTSSSTTAGPIPLRDRKHMIQRLCFRYEQMHSQSLQGIVRLELGLASRPNVIRNEFLVAWRLPDQPEQLFSPQTSILDAYKQAQQELLILGEPGIGKSMLLLELALYLVEQAERDTEQPVPVLLPLSSWADNQSQPLQEWLIEQVAQQAVD